LDHLQWLDDISKNVKVNLYLDCLSIDALLLKEVDGAIASRLHHHQVFGH
jgi:hypothetical protein